MPRGPFGGDRRILSIRGNCEPAIEITLSEMVQTDVLIEEATFDAPFQTDDVIVGVEEAESGPKPVVTVRALRKEIAVEDANKLVSRLMNKYDVEKAIIKSSIEADEADRIFGNILR